MLARRSSLVLQPKMAAQRFFVSGHLLLRNAWWKLGQRVANQIFGFWREAVERFGKVGIECGHGND